jgi:TPR repeat protein
VRLPLFVLLLRLGGRFLTAAEQWYTKAYENGFVLAAVGISDIKSGLYKETAAKLYAMGQWCLKKITIDGDYNLGLYCFRLAALKGNADAAMIVGNYLKQVVTEPKDWGVEFMIHAQLWYKLAGILGKSEGAPFRSGSWKRATPFPVFLTIVRSPPLRA